MSVFYCQTMHKRYSPIPLAFQYPLFYFCVPTGPSNKVGASPWLYGKGGVFSIVAQDYIDKGSEPVWIKLQKYLKQANIELEAWHESYLVTLPRVLGYHFNPLSVHFVVNTRTNKVDWWIMEVSNTFGEKHLYILNDACQTSPGTWKVPRQFHVSPFNPTTGDYIFNIKSPLGPKGTVDKIDVSITYHDQEGKVFWARLWSTEALEMTNLNLLKTIFTYPLTAFKTVPRILYQANRLHNKGLLVFDKPNPSTEWKGTQGTVVVNEPTTWETFCWNKIRSQLDGIPDGMPLEIHSADKELQNDLLYTGRVLGRGKGISVSLRNMGLFTTLMACPLPPKTIQLEHDLLWPMILSYVRGDYDVTYTLPEDEHVQDATVQGLLVFWTSLLQTKPLPTSSTVALLERRLRSFFSSSQVGFATSMSDLTSMTKGFFVETFGWASMETLGAQWVWDPYGIENRIVKYWQEDVIVGGKEEQKERSRTQVCKRVLKQLL
jgi:DUF1365 family protein